MALSQLLSNNMKNSIIFTDSANCVNKWMKLQQYQQTDYADILQQERATWEAIYQLRSRGTFLLKHIKAHTALTGTVNLLNAVADQLAKDAIQLDHYDPVHPSL